MIAAVYLYAVLLFTYYYCRIHVVIMNPCLPTEENKELRENMGKGGLDRIQQIAEMPKPEIAETAVAQLNEDGLHGVRSYIGIAYRYSISR